MRDLAVQWEMVLDSNNPARRPWRWNMTGAQRNEWIRTKPIQSEYSRPRESASRRDENHVPVTSLPTYVSKKWRDSLDQAGYEDFYPLASNEDHDEQLPARYSQQVRKKCSISLEMTKLVTPKDVENSRVCFLLDSTVDNNKPFHCL